MDGLTLFDKLLVYGLVFAMATAGLFPFLHPVFREWKRTLCSSRLRAAYAAISLLVLVYAGGSLDKQPVGNPLIQEILLGPHAAELLRDAPPSMPQWYQDLGYPTVDTDGDGIPDYWERRTHTQRLISDADADYDHDGVDNAEEFLHQCDPLTKDTDGDGLTDREEIDGALVGMAGFDPLVRCDYPEDTSDADAWETGWPLVSFVGVSASGFPFNVSYPDEEEDNVDVLITVDSTRYAELDWKDGTGTRQLLLPPCTNLVLRLRIPATESSSVSLSAAAGATGLWKAALRAEWDERRGNDIERNRVAAGNGVMVDIGNAPSVFAGTLLETDGLSNTEATRADSPRRGIIHNNAPPVVTFTVKTVGSLTGIMGCLVHGPDPVFSADFQNAGPPYRWTVNGTEYVTATPELTTSSGFATTDEMDVTCMAEDPYFRLKLTAHKVFRFGRCQDGPVTNIVGAAWTSTHNPTNATDHLPFVEEIDSRQYGPMCPVYTNTVIHAGWTHDEMILWLRNLVRKLTGKPEDDDTDHCINVTWVSGGMIDLWNYLDSVCLPYTNSLSIRVWENGNASGPPLHFLPMGPEPDEMLPTVKNLVLCNSEGTVVYDRFWLVISPPEDATSFSNWFDVFHTNLAWTATLPLPPSQLAMTTNTSGHVMASTPSAYTSQWSSPREFGNADFMHHTAKYEIRTEISSQFGNQATYDESGAIITNSIAAGTADFFGPYNALGYATRAISHKEMDVFPFLQALQLDGNPGSPSPLKDAPRKITHPCLRTGDHLTSYLFCRPCIY